MFLQRSKQNKYSLIITRYPSYLFHCVKSCLINSKGCLQLLKWANSPELLPCDYEINTLSTWCGRNNCICLFLGPSVMEVFMKGATGLHRESNIYSLRRYGLDPYDETKNPDDMVLVECADWHKDRKFNAFCILQYSATSNGMLLQWSCQVIKSHYRPNYKFEKRMSDKMK